MSYVRLPSFRVEPSLQLANLRISVYLIETDKCGAMKPLKILTVGETHYKIRNLNFHRSHEQETTEL